MSEKERAMTDAREALVGLIRDAYYSARDHGGTMDSAGRDAADAILAEFDVTPRGVHNHGIDPACPETRLPDGSLRGECMSDYTPTPEAVEAAARAMYAERMLTGDFPDGPTEWDDLPEPWRDEWREGATAALTAAGPIIAAEVERLRHVLREGQHMWDAAEQISRERDEALQRVADRLARVVLTLSERHCQTCTCGCTCGFGGEHVEDNPRCALTTKEADDDR